MRWHRNGRVGLTARLVTLSWTLAIVCAVIPLFHTAEAGNRPGRTITVLVVADQHYAAQTVWERKAERHLTDLAEDMARILDIKLQIAGYAVWQHPETGDVYRLTGRMVEDTPSGGADAVIGFTLDRCPKSPGEPPTGGVAIPFRGALIRVYRGICDYNYFIPYVMFHEMVHLLGGVHVADGSLMAPIFQDTLMLELDGVNRRIIRLTRDIDFKKGYASLGRKQLAQLIELYERITAAGKRESMTLSELGAMYQALGQPDLAQSAFRDAVAADSSFTMAWLRSAGCLQENGQVSEAIAVLEQALTRADDPGLVHQRLARLCLEAGRQEQAAQHARAARAAGVAVDSSLWRQLREQYPERQR
jgi:tetratricopeptide (TPR) repeat protein